MRRCIEWSIRAFILLFLAMVMLDKTLVLPFPVILLLFILVLIIGKPLSIMLGFTIGAELYLNQLLRRLDTMANQVLTRESSLPKAKYFRFAILGIVLSASVLVFVFFLRSGFTFRDIGRTIFGSTFISQFLDLILIPERFVSAIKANFTLVAVIALGVSSFLSFLYMRCTLETVREFSENRVVNFLLVLLFNLAFIVISGMLTEQIQALCIAIADGMRNMISYSANLYHSGVHSLWDIPMAVLCVLLLLILCPVTLYLLILTTREVVATLLYGFMAFFIFLTVYALSLGIIACFPNTPEWFYSIYFSVIHFTASIVSLVPDYIRSTDSLKQRLLEKVRQI